MGLQNHLRAKKRQKKYAYLGFDTGKSKEEEIGMPNVVLTSYNIIVNDSDCAFWRKFQFSYLVCDEAHYIKNASSKRYRNLSRFRRFFDLNV